MSSIEVVRHSLVAKAERLYRAGDYSAAAAAITACAPEALLPATAIRLLGLCRLHLGDPVGALVLLEHAVDLAPGDAWGRLHLAMGLQANGRPADAISHLEQAQATLHGEPAPSINLAGALLALGRIPEAVEVGLEACRRGPRTAAAHYALGQALLAAGDWPAAEAAFAIAVEIAPDLADGWVNAGLARYRLGRIEAAKAAMVRALRSAPRHRAALGNLAAFQRLTGEAVAAEGLLRAALEQDPGALSLRLNLAALLLQDEQAAEALDVLHIPPPADDASRTAWALQRVIALLQLGRLDAAEAALAAAGEVSAALTPLVMWRRVLLAEARDDPEAGHSAALEMQAALESAGDALLPEHAIMACFDLARFWVSRGDRVRAFDCWRQGHARVAPFQPFSRERHRAFVEASMEAFSRDRLRNGPRAADHDPTPVFIVGMPRSGTTLAEQILNAHSQAFGAGERAALGQTARRLGDLSGANDLPRGIASLGADPLDGAAATYLAELHALAPSAGRIVDKMPSNALHLGLVALMLPGARIIHCTRDPRDIGLSIFTFRFHGHHAYAHDLSDLGWYIAEQHRLMEHWKTVLPNPVLTLRLTDWIGDFDATLRRTLCFLGLPYEADCERFYEGESRVRTVSRRQVRQPINARGLGRWRPYAAQLTPLIAELRLAGLCPDEEG